MDEAIPFTYALEYRYLTDRSKVYGHRFAVRIKSGRTKFSVAFTDFYDLLKFSYTFNYVKKNFPYFKEGEKLRF